MAKSTVEAIRARFDADVERFSNLETGQSATVDAPLGLTLVAQAASATTPNAQHILDIGCGAGNYSLRLLQELPNRDVTLIDLSLPMLERAQQRVSAATTGSVTALQGDVRQLELGNEQVDIIVAAAVFHHLRDDAEWQAVFAQCYAALRPGGSLWIFDLVEHSSEAVHALMWQRYSQYLSDFRNEAYRDEVFKYIEIEDSPRPLLWQIDVLRSVGFQKLDILHKNSCFAAFGGVK